MKLRFVAWTMWVCIAQGCGGGGSPAADSSSSGAESTESTSTTTGGAQVCEPMPNGGVGIAFSGEQEPGVRCIDLVCPMGCDCHEVPVCNNNVEVDDDGRDVFCDGVEDCADGELCCAIVEGSSINRTSSSCVAGACPGGSVAVCNGDDECGGGTCVQGYTNDRALDIGFCQGGPPTGCTIEPGVDCSGAMLAGVDFTDGDLVDSNFCAADMSGARLRRAFFDRAFLTTVNLQGADVAFASFRNADLSGANLRDATIHDADFTGANLAGVDATGAVGNVICPDGMLVMVPNPMLCAGHSAP